MLELKQARGIVLDMDGVLYRGDEPLPGMLDFINGCATHQLPYLFVTNNSMRTPDQYVHKLAKMGANVPVDRIITSGTTLVDYLTQHYPRGTRIYMFGMPALHELLYSEATGFVFDPERPELVVNGSDLTFTYEKLKLAMRAIRAGATWIATNADTTLPVEDGLWPGAGALIAAVRAATNAEPLVLGKPEPEMMRQALARLGLPAEQSIMVGDRLDTDILGGLRVGMTTVLVLTGVEVEAGSDGQTIKADYVMRGLDELVERLWS